MPYKIIIMHVKIKLFVRKLKVIEKEERKKINNGKSKRIKNSNKN